MHLCMVISFEMHFYVLKCCHLQVDYQVGGTVEGEGGMAGQEGKPGSGLVTQVGTCKMFFLHDSFSSWSLGCQLCAHLAS